MNKLKIGNVELTNNIILAPMAGITDLPLRLLAKEGGAGLVYTEMVSARALVYGDDKTKKLLLMRDKERPVAVQIFGGDAYFMGEAAKIVSSMGADIIDINLGCPVRKIAKAGAGAKLLENEKLTALILEAVVKNSEVPVSVKIRIGLVPGQNVSAEIIDIAQKTGIKMVAVHARPASNGHSGEPDIAAFEEACACAKIPIIANGGITDAETAKRFALIKGCAGLMIGRGALGNYSIFSRLNSFLQKGVFPPEPSTSEKIQWLKKHALLAAGHYGEKKGLVIMRKVFHYYVKDMPNAAKLRAAFNSLTDINGFNEVLRKMTDNAALLSVERK
ncbi:MAG: tRNA dihydrouridine synthase DusB [Endomicrobium sp.]|jgi:tRNA-dihydrouridine synthase B|nr:tRNA dihydrouridine synthase DusB [Endomicrobium sp.]